MKAVLLIEDNEEDREIYSRLLYYNGYDLHFAATGEEGLTLAEATQPDLILLDLVLPGMDGFEVCTRLRERLGEDVPIVMLTGADIHEARPRALECGATAFVAKPAAPYEVLKEVRRLVGDSTPGPERPSDPPPGASPEPPEGSAPRPSSG